jgi:hypothetical protein
VASLGNVVHVAIQLLDFVPESVGLIMQCAVEHYHAGETTFLMPASQGNGDKCSGVNVAAHFCRSLDLQLDPQEEIPCALYLYNKKKKSSQHCLHFWWLSMRFLK